MTSAAGNLTEPNGARTIAAIVALGVVASFAIVVMPIMLGAMVDHLHLTARKAGLVASAEMSGYFVAALCMVPMVHRYNRRALALTGLLLLVAADVAAAATTGFSALAVTRFMAGLGCGVVTATIQASIAAARDPIRVYGMLGSGSLLSGVVGLPSMPLVITSWGISGAYLVLACLVLPGLLALRWLAPYVGVATQARTERSRLELPWVVVGLAAYLCYVTSFGAVVPYLERLGVASGLDVSTVGRVLGVAAAGGVVGASLATWLGKQFGRTLPLFAGVLCSAGGLWLLIAGMQPATYVPAAVAVKLAAMFTAPYALGSLAALDRTGRILVVGVMMHAVGLAIGPALSALLITGDNYARVGWLGITGYCASFALFLPLLLRIDRREGASAKALQPTASVVTCVSSQAQECTKGSSTRGHSGRVTLL